MSTSARAVETQSEEGPSSQPSIDADQLPRQPLHSQLADTVGSLRRLADLQLGIWLTRTKLAVLRIVLFAVLCLLSLLLAIIAIIFLYAGIYHVLTDLLLVPTPWALLIFAGVHFLFAGILGYVAIARFSRGNLQESAPGGAP